MSQEVSIYCGSKGLIVVDLTGLGPQERADFFASYSQVTQTDGAPTPVMRIPVQGSAEKVVRLQTVTRVLEVLGLRPRLNMGRLPDELGEPAPF